MVPEGFFSLDENQILSLKDIYKVSYRLER